MIYDNLIFLRRKRTEYCPGLKTMLKNKNLNFSPLKSMDVINFLGSNLLRMITYTIYMEYKPK